MINASLRLRKATAKYEPFVWITHKGYVLSPRVMATNHLFYTIRMLFNHSVPPALRIGEFKRYPDVPKWPISYRIRAIDKLEDEFISRDDAEPYQLDEYDDMLRNAELAEKLDLYK